MYRSSCYYLGNRYCGNCYGGNWKIILFFVLKHIYKNSKYIEVRSNLVNINIFKFTV